MTSAGPAAPSGPPSPPASPTPSIGARRAAPLPDPTATLRDARIVLDNAGAMGSPGWARGVVLLARQALEEAVSAFWMRRAPGTERANGKARFVALRFYVDDPDLPRRAHQTWAALSDATHHHGYELAPTAVELRAWVDTVADVIQGLALAGGGTDAPTRSGTSEGGT